MKYLLTLDLKSLRSYVVGKYTLKKFLFEDRFTYFLKYFSVSCVRAEVKDFEFFFSIYLFKFSVFLTNFFKTSYDNFLFIMK